LEGVSEVNLGALASFRSAIASLANVDVARVKLDTLAASPEDSPLLRALKGDAITVSYVVGGLASATDAAVLNGAQPSTVHAALQACAGAHGLQLGSVTAATVVPNAASRKLENSDGKPVKPDKPDKACPNGAISSSGYCCASSCGACGTCCPSTKLL
jgi:hypothetical protein